MTCKHTRVYTGERIVDDFKRVWYRYKCTLCGDVEIRLTIPDGECRHTDAAPVRTEERKACCGKTVPTKIFYCPECKAEFSVR